jgi:hypothetical protein
MSLYISNIAYVKCFNVLCIKFMYWYYVFFCIDIALKMVIYC